MGEAPFSYHGKYVRDEFRVPQLEKEIDSKGKVNMRAKIHPYYKPEKPYVPRSDRPKEYTKCGIIGRIPARTDATVTEDDWLMPHLTVPGLATKSPIRTNLQAASLVTPFDPKRNFAVFGCILNF
jgi:hypothetical protein